jgi:hypothetical protein
VRCKPEAWSRRGDRTKTAAPGAAGRALSPQRARAPAAGSGVRERVRHWSGAIAAVSTAAAIGALSGELFLWRNGGDEAWPPACPSR